MKKQQGTILLILSLLLLVTVVSEFSIPTHATGTEEIIVEQTTYSSYTGVSIIHPCSTGDLSGVAQAFNQSKESDYNLTQASFWLTRAYEITGNLTARLYDVTGTYGTNMKPNVTDTPYLAESEKVDFATITGEYAWINFSFTNGFRMTSYAHYCISLIYLEGSNVSGQVIAIRRNLTVTEGNRAYYSAGAWTGSTGSLSFVVYGTAIEEETPPTPPAAPDYPLMICSLFPLVMLLIVLEKMMSKAKDELVKRIMQYLMIVILSIAVLIVILLLVTVL